MDVVGEVEELLLAVGLSCGVARKEPLRSFTAARLPEPLHAQPEHTTAVRTAPKSPTQSWKLAERSGEIIKRTSYDTNNEFSMLCL